MITVQFYRNILVSAFSPVSLSPCPVLTENRSRVDETLGAFSSSVARFESNLLKYQVDPTCFSIPSTIFLSHQPFLYILFSAMAPKSKKSVAAAQGTLLQFIVAFCSFHLGPRRSTRTGAGQGGHATQLERTANALTQPTRKKQKTNVIPDDAPTNDMAPVPKPPHKVSFSYLLTSHGILIFDHPILETRSKDLTRRRRCRRSGPGAVATTSSVHCK